MPQEFRFAMPRLTPVAKTLIVLMVASFVATLVGENVLHVPVFTWLALNYAQPGLATLWQVLTHVLATPPLSQSIMSLGFAALFVWWMIGPFEERFGRGRTWQLVAVSALGAAIPALGVEAVLPGPRGILAGSGPILVGAIAAFAITLGQQQISFFGILPMKGIHVLWLSIGISLLYFLTPPFDHIEFIANLGAIGAAIGFMKFIQRKRRTAAKRPRRSDMRLINGGGGERERGDGPKWLN